MSYEIMSGYCPYCGSPVEYDEETQITRCVHCNWTQGQN
jgi:DNA-directed RNA polymerase subunit RPC12/RpoP